MRRHTQRHLACPIRGDGRDVDGTAGDCFRTALAGVLDLDLDAVPHFVGDYWHADDDDDLTEVHGAAWWRAARRWMRSCGYGDLACSDPPDLDGWDWSGYVILGGSSPRGRFGHAVIGWQPGLEVVWDPHPSRAGLNGQPDAVYLVVAPYDPPPPSVAEDPADLSHRTPSPGGVAVLH